LTSSSLTHSETASSNRGELFSLLLRLHAIEPGQVAPGAGHQVQAAFLDLVHQADPPLAEWMHRPNQRRPYTVGLLQGFNHLTKAEVEEARSRQQAVPVQPGQTYWLRISILDATVFGSFARYLIRNPRTLTVRIGDVHFEISRLVHAPDAAISASSWVAYSSFADLCIPSPTQGRYSFEFATPTAFSRGQKSWGKMLKVFPESHYVFESLARQWEAFAPVEFRMEAHGLALNRLIEWCEEHVIVTHYTLETGYLSFSRFGQVGFQGTVTYEIKGPPTASEAQWLSPLARFALFSGIGYKTTMGMGQARCLSVVPAPVPVQEDDAKSNEGVAV
jgi:CRISPR-associated endoribonuclease Cas6